MVPLSKNDAAFTRNGLEFLRDGHGIYGLDFRMKPSEQQTALIIRPDKFAERQQHRYSYVALQPVPLRPNIFRRSTERELANGLHRILFQQSARLDGLDPDCGSEGLRQDERLRRKFYGTEVKAYRIANALIRQLLDEAGDQDAIRAARRFDSGNREDIYWLASRSCRLLQICDSFPIIARIAAQKDRYADAEARTGAGEIIDAIERGKPLRFVAKLAGVPFVMRAVPPRAVREAYDAKVWFERNPHLINHMPKTARAARSWFFMLHQVNEVSPDFAGWCAKRMPFDRFHEEVAHEVRNISDWVKACYQAQADAAMQELMDSMRHRVPAEYFRAGRHGLVNGYGLVRRHFTPSMSLATIRRLSEEWHDAVADRQYSAENAPLPEPWAKASDLGGRQIVPLAMAQEIYHEGKAMRHCVGEYVQRVRWGNCYLYSLREGERRLATIEVLADGASGVQLGQITGPCNLRLDRKTARLIDKWFRSTKFTRPGPKESKARQSPDDWIDDFIADAADLDAEIPF